VGRVGLVGVDDAGDAFHVGCDEDFHVGSFRLRNASCDLGQGCTAAVLYHTQFDSDQ
jgi:hypothetical protein